MTLVTVLNNLDRSFFARHQNKMIHTAYVNECHPQGQTTASPINDS